MRMAATILALLSPANAGRPAAQPQVEQAAVELERAVDVVDLERDVVDSDEARLHYGSMKCTSPNSCQR